MMENMSFLRDIVKTYRQRLEFLPFLRARLQQKQGNIPEFKVCFSIIGAAKPTIKGSAEKEFILLKVNFDEDVKPGKNYSKAIARGNRLMGKIGLLTLTRPFTDKTLMNIDVGIGTVINCLLNAFFSSLLLHDFTLSSVSSCHLLKNRITDRSSCM